MPSPSKQKGYRVEREIVKLHELMGVEAERIPLSGAAGGSFKGDVIINNEFRAEVKCRGGGQGFSTLEGWLGDNDLLFLRKDRSEPFVAMRWKVYQKLMERGKEMRLRPLEDNILIREDDAEDTYHGTIIIPDAGKEKPQVGTVMAVGDGLCVDGKVVPMSVKEGDRVFFSKYTGTTIKLDGEELVVMTQSDIFGVLEDD